MGLATVEYFAAFLAIMLLLQFFALIVAANSLILVSVLPRAEFNASFDGLADAVYRRLLVGEI